MVWWDGWGWAMLHGRVYVFDPSPFTYFYIYSPRVYIDIDAKRAGGGGVGVEGTTTASADADAVTADQNTPAGGAGGIVVRQESLSPIISPAGAAMGATQRQWLSGTRGKKRGGWG